ncbi:sodium:proton exchanger [Nocardioides sp. HDW12B]|uniref:sodium:proton exchanger n=1 Tax=Nocardioides sp. HDW12B TaxID=2714939 RepID=UPI001407BD1E|nr:sodium:proton exchanger [Nocardioides sp. HDW12B]QIK65179.1 sodium:proton exchanger [Nocardioides sp. HDW12B]
MPTTDTERSDRSSQTGFPLQLGVAAAVTLLGAWMGFAAYFGISTVHFGAPVEALVYGAAIVGAAFILSWAAEAVQVDINAGLALALLALLAVLPEYAVDFVFTAKCGGEYAASGGSPEICGLSLANMTGANRVLVGVGWPLVVLVATFAVWHARRSGNDKDESESPSTHAGEVRLAPTMSAEVVFLGIATLYSLTLPLKDTLTLFDMGVFLAIFAAYAWRLAKMPATEPDLLGVSQWVGEKDTRPRRTWVIGMFVFAAIIILLSAEHFAESLVATGAEIGVSEFLLVQWVAPLASESPELIVACLYAWRLKAGDSLGTLLSSKVNQWTLLVGGLPLVFAISAGTLDGLPLDTEQRFELLITAAQSLFAVAVLIDLSLSFRGALMLIGLFSVQFFVSIFGSSDMNRWTIIGLSVVYIVLALVRFARLHEQTRQVIKDGTVTDYAKLDDEPAG